MKYTTGSVRTRKNRKVWIAALKYKDEEGRWKEKTKTLSATTKTEAKRELAEWRAEMEAEAEREAAENGRPIGLRASAIVADYVAGMVDRLEASKAIEASTVAGYRASCKIIAAAFSEVTMKDLTAAQAQEWEASLTARGLSSSTVGKAHRLLKQAMKEAATLGLIAKNPLDAVRPPKRRAKKSGINALDLNGRTRLLDALDAMELTPLTVAARAALYTGLRRGEICGLRWCDVDLEGRTLWVKQAIGRADGGTYLTVAARAALYTGLRRGEICGLRWCDVDLEGRTLWVKQAIGRADGGTYIKQTKTDQVRDIAIPEALAVALEAWRDQQSRELAAAAATVAPQAYVLTGTRTYESPTALTKQWLTMAKALGIKGTEGRTPTFHDLRHTWATAAVAAGVDIKTVASNLGHANAAMTLNIYASPDPDAKRRAAETMEDAIRAPKDAALPFKRREASA